MTRLRTPLTELLGVEHPVVQTGMGWVAGARLVAATSNAGGLGFVGFLQRSQPGDVAAMFVDQKRRHHQTENQERQLLAEWIPASP